MSASDLAAVLLDLANGRTETDPRLEAVAKRLQTDADFRVEVGDMKSVWTDLSDLLAKVVSNGLNPEQVEQLMFLFRIVRNTAANAPLNQDRARVAGIPGRIQEIVSQAAHTHYGNMEYIMMLRAGVQALSNLLTGNEASKNWIWKSLLVQGPSPSCDHNLLSTLAAVEDETIVLSTVLLCYNCVYKSPERSQTLLSTSPGRNLIRQLLNESQATSSLEERKSFEMIYTFFNHLIGQDYFQQLFDAVAIHEGDEDGSIRYHGEGFHKEEHPLPNIQGLRIEEIKDEDEDSTSTESGSSKNPRQPYICPEQVILLKFIDSRVYTHHQQQQDSDVDQHEPAVSLETVGFLTEVFGNVSKLTIQVLQTLDLPGVGQHSVEDLSNLSAAVTLLLGCFSHLCLYDDGQIDGASAVGTNDDNHGDVDGAEKPGRLLPVPDWFKAQHMAIVKGELVENAIELLRQADKSLARVTKPATSQPTSNNGVGANSDSTLLSNTSTLEGQQSFFVGLKRDIVRVVGNLAYCSRHVQDRIRACNGLIVMLSQCNIDDANPYLREYAILAMKNILTGNAENQALIEELQPIEAVDHPALQEARVTARLDAKTGRPVLSQDKRRGTK
ncbi:ataxin-10 [Entomortierella parvispora]|uniref:Ataxin-10 homolog n=1 Tax=Entomortierella parvispora TaxID=205924 RepID=A0A9P3LV37_9FUNG|nr:ataxin-10 [Entomortierella parvispora]